MLPFALTIFTGAFLLFQVQPVIGKFILPWFGGSPGVWTTCLLFFQTLLLGGYAYAHFSTTYLKPRAQAVLHMALLLVSLALLPIAPDESWKTQVEGEPVGRILLLLMVTIGLPYFVLSATGPLMQRWFSETNPGVSPYRLYALSNVGSLLALLSYPFFFEVKLTRLQQSTFWSAGLVGFVIVCGVCAWRVWQRGGEAAGRDLRDAADDAGAPSAATFADRLMWVGLPAIASILLLATTNKLCQEVSVIPFLWVLPLSLYLLSFILCFDHARWYVRQLWVALLMIGTVLVCQLLGAGTDAPMWFQIVGYCVALFAACMVCHGELYRLRPAPRQLTGYYLMISAGGALGGLMVAVVAPAMLNDYRELQAGLWMLSYALGAICLRQRSRELALGAGVGLMMATLTTPAFRALFKDGLPIWEEYTMFYEEYGLVICGALLIFALTVLDLPRFRVLPAWQPRMAGFLMMVCFGIGVMFFLESRRRGSTPVLSASRNFYGTLKVYHYAVGDPESYRLLLHGATTHGFQFDDEDIAMRKTSYYAEESGVGRAIFVLPQTPRRIGLVGLGTGTLAAYGREGDYLRIYEINPEVERLARSQFTYLENSLAAIDVIMGDARLSMEKEVAAGESQQFDLLALDAFSSDAIPVHLLTKEAFEIYLRQVKENGIIAVHISNRYLDLRPIVENLADHLGLHTVAIHDDDAEEWWVYRTSWILVARNKALLEDPTIAVAADTEESHFNTDALWTDDYASLYDIIR